MMVEEMRVVLVDANHSRRHDAGLILSFLGEDCVSFSPEEFLAGGAELLVPEGLLAVFLGDIQTTQVLVRIAQWSTRIPVVFLEASCAQIETESPNPDNQLGAADTWGPVVGHLSYPFRYAETLSFLHRCQLERGNRHVFSPKAGDVQWFLNRKLVGSSDAIVQVQQLIGQVAHSDASVLILGESGVGKEVVARQIHAQSLRHHKAFVPINCGAIPAELLESELFGHEKGAFTGAFSARQGRFELAQGGTLFLDEIGDMPLPMQVKLLRVLQEKKFERVGSNKTIQADVRIIAATHRNLADAIECGTFREDLFYRLNVFPIEVPALRERPEDIPLLVADFLHHMEEEGRGGTRLLPAAMRALSAYRWPGNVRELANLIERLTILYPHGVVDVADLPPNIRAQGVAPQLPEQAYMQQVLEETDWPSEGIDLKGYLHDMEVRYIKEALKESGGVVSKAADLLKMRRTTLVEKMKKYKLEKSEPAWEA